jgi:proteasome lid subunit RPN8/RPN11
MAELIRIVAVVLKGISAETARQPDMECCGLLGGQNGIITRTYPADNELASATAYEIAPRDLFRIVRQIRADGLELMGIYHSHPTGDNSPSPIDIDRAFYPDTIYFISSPVPASAGANPGRATANPIRAFRIRDRIANELRMEPMMAPMHCVRCCSLVR